MSSRIFTGVQAAPDARPVAEQAGAPDTDHAVADKQRLDTLAGAVRRRSERATRDSVRWDEPAALVALAIASVIAAAVLVFLALAIV